MPGRRNSRKFFNSVGLRPPGYPDAGTLANFSILFFEEVERSKDQEVERPGRRNSREFFNSVGLRPPGRRNSREFFNSIF